jgi:hypothetical protein
MDLTSTFAKMIFFQIKKIKTFIKCSIPSDSRGVLHGSYKKSLLWGVPSTATILHGENEVFQRNRNDFPKVSFTLDVI